MRRTRGLENISGSFVSRKHSPLRSKYVHLCTFTEEYAVPTAHEFFSSESMTEITPTWGSMSPVQRCDLGSRRKR